MKKYSQLLIFLILSPGIVFCQTKYPAPDTARFIEKGYVRYRDFGAKGDGQHDDIRAIAATHAFANRNGLAVKADNDASYYIGGTEQTVVIQTDTDFGTANFIIDDRQVENREAFVFMVTSNKESYSVHSVTSLSRDQEKLDITLNEPALITVTDENVKRYKRYGLNQNEGKAQTDIFLVDREGNVDMRAPVVWDFDQISEMTVLPMDQDTLRITGGRFTTIANAAESKYTYYSRNIAIRRSNVIIEGLEHRVTGEGEQGAPYGGFINITGCAFVRVENCILTGRKTYTTIGSAGKPVNMGSYDLQINRSVNVSIIHCRQTNDINDRTYWGIMASNYSKNLVYDHCTLSRFDAHMGVANATIKNSTLGYMGINAIGTGILRVENTSVSARTFINLRSDYGSTWEGEFIISNCVYVPSNGNPDYAVIIGGSNSGMHDFGYPCFMPRKITIDGFRIEDANARAEYRGPAIFANVNPELKDDTYREKFPYILPRKVILKDISIASGNELRISDNDFMFRNVMMEYR